MNLHHLELFYYVAKHGGISRAVRHIPYGIQQPAVSGQVLMLEQDLGVKLFDRQPFRLTAEGQELFAFAQPFFDQAEGVARRLRNRAAPTLRIAAAELILRDYLPGVLDRVREREPGLRFALRAGLQADFERWLQEGEIDVAVAPLAARPQAGLKAVSIVKLPPVLLVAKGSPIKSAGELWARDVIEEPLICLPPGEALARVFQQGLREMKVAWLPALEASSTEVVTQYVASGYGIGVGLNLPHLIRHPKVRALALPGFAPVEIAVLWRPPEPPYWEAFAEAVRERARHLWPDPVA